MNAGEMVTMGDPATLGDKWDKEDWSKIKITKRGEGKDLREKLPEDIRKALDLEIL